MFKVPGTLRCWQRGAGRLPLLFKVTSTPVAQICLSLPSTHVVVHPADAGVAPMRVRDAKAAAARMSFFMINTPS